MIRVWYGKKGVGKTKALIDDANALSEKAKGDVVFIDRKANYKFELSHKVRFVNSSEYPITDCKSFLGFVCGILTGNYDIETIYIDGLTHIVKYDADGYESFYTELDKLGKENNVNFCLTHLAEDNIVPSYLEKYI